MMDVEYFQKLARFPDVVDRSIDDVNAKWRFFTELIEANVKI